MVWFVLRNRGVVVPDGLKVIADWAELIYVVWIVQVVDVGQASDFNVLEGTKKEKGVVEKDRGRVHEVLLVASEVGWVVVDEGREDFREGSWGEEGVEWEVDGSGEKEGD